MSDRARAIPFREARRSRSRCYDVRPGQEGHAMETDGSPIGEALDWHPVPAPRKRVLEGAYVRLEPVDVERHAADLFALSQGHDAIWTYLGYGPFADLASFRSWLAGCAQQSDPHFVAIVDEA